MPKVKLWNTELGKLTAYDVMVDNNGEIVCEYNKNDVNDVIKFPGGLTKDEFLELVNQHNDANAGIKALDTEELEERDKANEELLKSL